MLSTSSIHTLVFKVQEVPRPSSSSIIHCKDQELSKSYYIQRDMILEKWTVTQFSSGNGLMAQGRRKPSMELWLDISPQFLGAARISPPNSLCQTQGVLPTSGLMPTLMSRVLGEGWSGRHGPLPSWLALLSSPSRGPADTR